MRANVQEFATALLDHARTSNELEIMLNFNPTGDNWEPGERQTLDRLKTAIKFKQKMVKSLINLSIIIIQSGNLRSYPFSILAKFNVVNFFN